MATLCFLTTTRADWGLLSPLAAELRRRGHTILIVASNMHLDAAYGATASEIQADGFSIDAAVPLPGGDTPADRAVATGVCTQGVAEALRRLAPEVMVALGDRYEMLGAVTAAAVSRIPVVHIAGGEVSEGAQDDAFRHAITKLSDLHLVATPEYRRRVVQMGEDPARVVHTGAIGVYNFLKLKPVEDAELARFLNLDLDDARPLAIATYHPATLDAEVPHTERTRALLRALDSFADLRVVLTYPNNDAGAAETIPMLQQWAQSNPERVRLIPSLGARRYLSLLRHAAVVVGNSSSGIVEVPSAGIPTVDIGIRQRGRAAAASVIHCAPTEASIVQALSQALSPEFRSLCRTVANPYFRSDTLHAMADAIEKFLSGPREPKKFHDL